MRNEITREGQTPYYGRVPCRVFDAGSGYVHVDLLKDPGFGSMHMSNTAAGNVTWKPSCEWCAADGEPQEDAQRPEDLCRTHQAEYEGLSEDELDRRDHEEAMDLM